MSDHDDPLDHLRKHLRRAKIHSDSEVTPESAARDFLRLNQNQRAEFLGQIQDRLEDPSLSMSVERATDFYRYHSRLLHSHRMATKVGR